MTLTLVELAFVLRPLLSPVQVLVRADVTYPHHHHHHLLLSHSRHSKRKVLNAQLLALEVGFAVVVKGVGVGTEETKKGVVLLGVRRDVAVVVLSEQGHLENQEVEAPVTVADFVAMVVHDSNEMLHSSQRQMWEMKLMWAAENLVNSMPPPQPSMLDSKPNGSNETSASDNGNWGNDVVEATSQRAPVNALSQLGFPVLYSSTGEF